MTFVADRVKETTTTTGTGTVSLAGAYTGFQSFATAFTTGSTVYYAITDGVNWEIGSGVFTSGAPSTLSRATVLASSNSNALVNFTAGSMDVFCTLPAGGLGGTQFNNQSGTTYTPVLSDGVYQGSQGAMMTFNNAAAVTVTIPPNSSVAYPVGTTLMATQLGAGKVTLAQGAGVTINSAAGNKSIGSQYAGVTLVQTAANVWLLMGSLIV